MALFTNRRAKNTILVRIKSDIFRDEGIATAAIKPGMLLQYSANAASGRLSLTAHAAAGLDGPRAIAIEDVEQGKGVDSAFALGDLVPFVVPGRGEEVLLLVAASMTLVVGDAVESAGDGTFRKYTNGIKIAVVKQAVTTAAGVNTLTICEII